VASDVEPVAAVLDRATGFIADLERQHSGRDILLVSHGDTLQILQAGFLRIDPSRHRSLPHLATAEFRRLHLTEKPAGNCFAPGSYPEAGDRQGSWGGPVPPCSSPPVPWPRRRSSLIVFDSICRMLSRVTP
jgi:broad specificity phosphatase PhoE